MTNVAAPSAWIWTTMLVAALIIAEAAGNTAYSASDVPSAQEIDLEKLLYQPALIKTHVPICVGRWT